MAIWHAVNTVTGLRQRTSLVQQTDVEPLEADEELKVFPLLTEEPDPAVKRWNPITKDYEDVVTAVTVVPTLTMKSKLQLRTDLGFDWDDALTLFTITLALPPKVRSKVMTMKEWLNSVTGDVVMEDPRTQGFIENALMLLSDPTLCAIAEITPMTAQEVTDTRARMNGST